jgi:hypothetical protein
MPAPSRLLLALVAAGALCRPAAAPGPERLQATISPPCARTMSREIERPRPEFLPRLASVWGRSV